MRRCAGCDKIIKDFDRIWEADYTLPEETTYCMTCCEKEIAKAKKTIRDDFAYSLEAMIEEGSRIYRGYHDVENV